MLIETITQPLDRIGKIDMPYKKEFPDRYHAYLLRFWRSEEAAGWRASLEDPHSGKTRGFASMKALFAYLKARTSTDSSSTYDDGNVSSADG